LLNRAPVLVAEDEPFIALDLALAIEDAGGEVVGPAASVEEALALLSTRTVAAAILDVDLVDGDSWAVVEALAILRVPMIIQTGVGIPPAWATRLPGPVVHIKPCVTAQLIAQLEDMLAGDGSPRGSL